MRPIREGEALVGVAGAPPAVGHSAHPGFWRTPTPYLLLGFSLMMGLIAVSLLVLVYTDRKPSGSSRRGSAGEDASTRGMALLDWEPKVVVIMAGDDMPSFLLSARPFAFPAVKAADPGEQRKADAA